MACTTECVSFLNGVVLPYDPAAPGNYTLPDGTELDFGVIPSYLNDASRDSPAKAGLLVVFALAFIVATARVGARLSTRVTGAALGFGWDDAILVVTGLLYTAFVGLAIALINVGASRHIEWIVLQGMIDEHMVAIQEILDVAAHLIYTTAMYTSRLSALAFFSRLSSQSGIRRGIWIVLTVITAFYLTQMFTLIFHCHPVTALWPYNFQVSSSTYTCQGWNLIYLINAVLGFPSDLAVFVIPACLVFAFKGARADKITLALVLFPGVIVIAVSVTRLGVLGYGYNDADQSWLYGSMIGLESAEIGGTMIALSVPALKVLADHTFLKNAKARPSQTTASATISSPLTWPSELEKGYANAHIHEKSFHDSKMQTTNGSEISQ